MFSVGNTLIYGSNGICQITGVQELELDQETRTYYVLKPVFENNLTFYIPVDNETSNEKLRRILSVEEIYALIREMPQEETIWTENDNERKEKFKQILAAGDRSALIKLIKTVYLHQQELQEKGKKLHVADERSMKDAEKALYDEFAYVLNIKQEDVLPFITEQLAASSVKRKGSKRSK